MSSRISKTELIHLRNDIPIRTVLHALLIPWKQDDELTRFYCPLCGNMHSSIHPTENLARCFDCQKNFNPIDLVRAQKKCGFTTAVLWLRVLRQRIGDKCFSEMIHSLKRRMQIT